MNKQEIYDELCRVITEYEEDNNKNVYDNLQDMYNIMVEIQNNWETVITAQD